MTKGLFLTGLRSLLASVLASGAAFLFNRAASRGGRPGPLLAFVLGPGVEETAKTGFALAMAAPVLAVHLGFGAVEAVYDASAWLWHGPDPEPGPEGEPASLSARGLAAGAMSLLSHAAFGVVTQAVLTVTLEPLFAVAAAVLAHAAWNLAIVALVGAGGRL